MTSQEVPPTFTWRLHGNVKKTEAGFLKLKSWVFQDKVELQSKNWIFTQFGFF